MVRLETLFREISIWREPAGGLFARNVGAMQRRRRAVELKCTVVHFYAENETRSPTPRLPDPGTDVRIRIGNAKLKITLR